MPIVLDELDLSAVASGPKTVTPKFFSSKLTGGGKSTGLLNQNLLPVNTTTNTAYRPYDYIEMKSSSTQNNITTSMIPFAPITRRALTNMAHSFTVAVPHADDRFTVQTSYPTTGALSTGWEICFDMSPQAAVLYEDKSGGRPQRDLIIQYRMELYLLEKGLPEPDRVSVTSSGTSYTALPGSRVALRWSTSPLTEAAEFIDNALLNVNFTNPDALEEWLRDYDIYDRITRQAQAWNSDQIADEVSAYIADLPAGTTSAQYLNVLAEQLRYLENYNVPLDAYRQIHKTIDTTFSADVAGELSKQNLNLLMNHTLDQLDRMKPRLTVPAAPAQTARLPGHLSKQQLDALTTHEPLVMTQAGAGTGKSTVILQRIEYLRQCGVDSRDITVLSFTNAAADNITAKNPNVGSMTIARMIHDIYALNHPTHELSSVDTIINSLEIFYPNSGFAARFRPLLMKVDKNEPYAYTEMNAFIENHFNEVMEVLDQIKQTSLELEIIVCYQQIDHMIEPPHVRCQYLIIDEVQDNSIFEFIYLLKYITKHAQSLFIVGDASQTLYEFRSANPRALNTLESSDVFATFKLTTNYRSNQEILDFANLVLGELETNQFAGIQLQADSLASVTAGSFQEKVTLDYRTYPRLQQFLEDLPGIAKNTIVPAYVEPCLDRGEQVAFLAYTRREVQIIQQILEQKYPQRHVASLVSERVYATDVFSKYIKNFWNDVLQVPPDNASYVFSRGVLDNLDKLTRNAAKSEKAIRLMLSDWWLENNEIIRGWVTLARTGALSHGEYFERLRDNLLTFEIRRNAVHQSVMNQKNRERKQKNAEAKADLVVSTIHGAKGMEFDNVVIIHKEDTQMPEDVKRMYYVAFTRAVNSEYVLSYGKVKNAPIESNYAALVKTLEERDMANAARAAGTTPEFFDEALDEKASA